MITPPTPVLIVANTVAESWIKLITAITTVGAEGNPDYPTGTRRVHATIVINNPTLNRVHPLVPFGTEDGEKMKRYIAELTRDYGAEQAALPDGDDRKFEYTYAEQLFMFGTNHYDTINALRNQLRVGSRRHVAVLWDNELYCDTAEDQPCWISYKIEDLGNNKLALYIIYRSWDAYGGYPANLPAIFAMFEREFPEYDLERVYLTGWDTHIYDSNLDDALAIIEQHKNEFVTCFKCGRIVLKTLCMPSMGNLVCWSGCHV